MNNRQYRNKIPDILTKTLELMGERRVPIRSSWQNSGELAQIPELAFVPGEEYRLVSGVNGSMLMEIGEEFVDDKRLDPVVYLLTTFLHDEASSKDEIELSARFIQIAYRFKYNKNSVKGLFFYCKINDIKHGDKFKEATAMASNSFSVEDAMLLTNICKGIII
ncbi:MAG: hypothetical protein HQL69_12835 [Magnetococcales bacterium]|nr:hypothetical protein [Magnetococcales bacterium]